MTKQIPMNVSPQEARLILFCRKLMYGQFVLKVHNSQPVHIDQAKQSVDLTKDIDS